MLMKHFSNSDFSPISDTRGPLIFALNQCVYTSVSAHQRQLKATFLFMNDFQKGKILEEKV